MPNSCELINKYYINLSLSRLSIILFPRTHSLLMYLEIAKEF